MLLTDKERAAVEMRFEGHTYDEIGKMLGVTRQRAYQICSNAVKVAINGRGGNKLDDRCYYPNLAQYIREHYKCVKGFTDASRIDYVTVMNMLRKGSEPSWRTVKKLCQFTGMNAETLMMRDDEYAAE